MKLGQASLSLVVRFVMSDLDNYLEEKDDYLTPHQREDIETWFEWATADDVTIDEKKIVLNEIHEYLGEMRVWADEEEEYRKYLSKINMYFVEKYESSETVNKFRDILLNYYKEQIAEEWNIG